MALDGVTSQSLNNQLKHLGASTPIPQFPDSKPLVNPVDVYRSYLAGIISGITGASSQLVYSALQWTRSLDHGDLILAVPQLRLKGSKPAALVMELAKMVREFLQTDPKALMFIYAC
jgi:arginyl-tRNA synthetase